MPRRSRGDVIGVRNFKQYDKKNTDTKISSAKIKVKR